MRGYDGDVDESRVPRQQCLVHLMPGLSRVKSKLSDETLQRYGWLLEEMRELQKSLIALFRGRDYPILSNASGYSPICSQKSESCLMTTTLNPKSSSSSRIPVSISICLTVSW